MGRYPEIGKVRRPATNHFICYSCFRVKGGELATFQGINSCCIQPTLIDTNKKYPGMCEHEKKYCPRCRTRFECKVGSILLCQCASVILTEAERNYLHEKYEDCLCGNCMKELKTEFHNNQFKQKLKKLFGIFSPK